MKGITTFLQSLRALHKSGKLDDATCRELNIAVTQLRHSLHIGDRRKAERQFERLCELMRDVLVQE